MHVIVEQSVVGHLNSHPHFSEPTRLMLDWHGSGEVKNIHAVVMSKEPLK